MRYLIGLGTYAAWDDSVGLRIAERIAEEGLDDGFTAIELGGNLLDLVHYLGGDAEVVLLVDCARMGLEPGAYAFFTPEQVATRKALAGFSSHEGDLMNVLELARAMGPLPPVTIMGIEPAEVREGVGLSSAVEMRIGEYVGAAVKFMKLAARGV